MTSFTVVVDEKLDGFVKHANKGLHYGEEVFCAGFNFDEGDDVKEILVIFITHLDSLANGKGAYARFLERNRIHEDVRRSLQNPDLGQQISIMIRTELYKRLALHISASDFLDMAKGGLTSEFYFLKVVRSMGESGFSVESGINLYFIINRRDKELYFLQTVFN